MKFTGCIIITLKLKIIFAITELHNNNILTKIINNLKPYETVIFTDHSMKKINLLENLIIYNPTVLLELSNQTCDIRSFELSIFQNPRQTSVYIMIINSLVNISDILDNIMEEKHFSPRPKTLLIISIDYTDKYLKMIFSKSWSLKFLDFTIVQTDSDNIYTFLTYNPFTSEYIKQDLKDTTEIFLDKLRNVDKYPLITRAFELPPVIVPVVVNNTIVKVEGTSIQRIKTIADKLNFNLTFIGPMLETEVVEKFSENLESNEINITPIGFRYNVLFKEKKITQGYPMDISKLNVIVPIIKVPRIDLTTDMWILLLIFCMILIIFFAFVCSLKLNPDYWNIFYVFGILIGTTIAQPQKNVSRLIYLTIAVLSIIFSNDSFSTLANVKLLYEDLNLNTIDDLKQLKMPLYIPAVHYLLNNTKDDESLVSYGQRIDTIDTCLELLIETNKVACVTSSQRAEFYLKTFLNPQGHPIMKITEMSWQHRFDAYVYEKASPFEEKIEKMLRHIYESKILSVHELLATSKKRIIQPKQSFNEEVLLTQIILIVLTAGYTFAFITFVYEFVRFYGFFKNVSF